jgi:hypothetical protein
MEPLVPKTSKAMSGARGVANACRRAWRAAVRWVGRVGREREREREQGQRRPSAPAAFAAPAAPLTPADDAFWDPKRPFDRRTAELWHKQLEQTKLVRK